jgi:hypothetical protein
MTTTPQEPGDNPDVVPSGDPDVNPGGTPDPQPGTPDTEPDPDRDGNG